MSPAAQAQAAAAARRRRRRPQRSASADALDAPDDAVSPRGDWDENAYLAGRVPLISERDYTPLPPAPGENIRCFVD